MFSTRGLEAAKAEKLAVIEDQDAVGVKRDKALDRGRFKNAAIDFNKQRIKNMENLNYLSFLSHGAESIHAS